MGRLFWKFFFFIWLAQLSAMSAIAVVFWAERQQDIVHWQAVHPEGAPPGNWQRPPPPPPDDRLSPPPHRRYPQPLPLLPILASVFASLLFAALLAWYFSKPIRSLRTAFAAAATGDLSVRLGEEMGGRRDELADLGRDFDRMASQLQSLVDGQRRLLHDVSHELRSPLARLQAAIGLLRQKPENMLLCCERIERESGRMDKLVGELLTLSRLEAGVAQALDEEIALAELLADIAQDAGFEAQAKNRSVELQCAGEYQVRGNGLLLQRAIENVVRNAIRHTVEASTVSISAGPEESGLRIRVCDSGPGVSEARLEAIFEPFFRAHAEESSDGHGLGLAIARRIILAHGGAIRARNRVEGGLCVEIDLPLAAA